MMFTYLNDYELPKMSVVSNQELNDLFQEVRMKFDNKYFMQERVFTTKKWFRKPVHKTLYCVYYSVGGCEYQMLNFCSEPGGSSIHPFVPMSYIFTLFHGLLNGFDYIPKSPPPILTKQDSEVVVQKAHENTKISPLERTLAQAYIAIDYKWKDDKFGITISNGTIISKDQILTDLKLQLESSGTLKNIAQTNTILHAVFDAGGQGLKDVGLMGVFDSEDRARETVGEKWVSIKPIEMNVLNENGL